MARKMKRGKRGSKRKSGSLSSGKDRTITITGKCLLQVSVPVANDLILFPLCVANNGVIATLLGDRVAAFSDVFQEFRFNRLSVKLHPGVATGGVRSDIIAVYSKLIPGGSVPATLPMTDLYELDASRILSAQITVPQMLSLGPDLLKSGLRIWYSCQDTGLELPDYCNGTLIFSADLTDTTFLVEIGYSVSFRGDTAPAFSPPPAPNPKVPTTVVTTKDIAKVSSIFAKSALQISRI
jgi:hypothetical protein